MRKIIAVDLFCGAGARPMHPDWPRRLRDQCEAANVPYFFKQWGAWMSVEPTAALRKQASMPGQNGDVWAWPDGTINGWRTGLMAKRVGKKNAGRELDGRTWDEMPESRTGEEGV